MLCPMKNGNQKTGQLLDSAVDLMFEIHLMRGDCCLAARSISAKTPIDEAAIEECARLEESLAKVYRNLQSTLKAIQNSRGKPRKRASE